MESLAFHPSWTEAVRAAYEDFILGSMPTLDFLFDVCFYSTPSKCRALMCVREHVQSGRVMPVHWVFCLGKHFVYIRINRRTSYAFLGIPGVSVHL